MHTRASRSLFPQRPTPRRAFTLIEVLVVVAIIAMLVAILIPSLSKTQKLARSTVCTSNIRQFGIALSTYGAEQRDYVPRGGRHDNPQHWIILVAKQFGDKSILKRVNQVAVENHPIYSCPERRRTLPTAFVDYIINAMKSDIRPGQFWGAPDSEVGDPTRLDEWKYPYRVLLLGEAALEDRSSLSPNNVMQARLNYEAGKSNRWNILKGLDDMDVWQPNHVPSAVADTRRAARVMHLDKYTNWLHGDMHVDQVKWLNGEQTCLDWIHLFGVQNPDKTCSN